MGKRELLLVVFFAVVGAVLYQATAPPPPPGATGFSLTNLMRGARSHLGDRDATRVVTRTTSLASLPESVTLHLDDFRGRLEVVGEDTDTVVASLDVTLRGLDEGDLDEQDAAIALDVVAEGDRVTVSTRQREMGPRGDQAMRVRVPRRLALQLSGRGVADVRGVASARIDAYRGDLVVEDVQGAVTGSHRDGRAEFGAGTSLDLETQRSTLRLVRPAAVTLDAEATDIEVTDAAGAVSIEQQRCTTEVVGGEGPLTVRGAGGTIKLRNIRSAIDIDAQRLTVSMIMAAPAPARIAIEGDDVEVTLPPGGVEVAAQIERGALRAPDALTSTSDGDVHRAEGTLEGGGPRITLEVVRGSLTIRRP